MKKKKVFSLFTTLILCLCTMAIGVYAAKTANVSAGGSVTFTATDCYCTVAGSATGGATNPSYTTTEINRTTSTVSWTNKAAVFDSVGTDIVITITITNKAPDRSIAATIADNSNTLSNATQSFNTTSANIAKGTSSKATFTITLAVTNKNLPASGNYAFKITLTATVA